MTGICVYELYVFWITCNMDGRIVTVTAESLCIWWLVMLTEFEYWAWKGSVLQMDVTYLCECNGIGSLMQLVWGVKLSSKLCVEEKPYFADLHTMAHLNFRSHCKTSASVYAASITLLFRLWTREHVNMMTCVRIVHCLLLDSKCMSQEDNGDYFSCISERGFFFNCTCPRSRSPGFYAVNLGRSANS
jgi:hypothetical protein